MRIWAVSDLHADVRGNRARLDVLSPRDHRGDALIVAGDIADAPGVVGEVLGFLRDRFREVWFVPGNHELWVRNDPGDSVEKFHALLELCDTLGVRTRPARAGSTWVVPLFAWYEREFDAGGQAPDDQLEAWSDFYFCRWPAGVERPADYFLALNDRHLRRYDGPVVTFSHFLPRRDLIPPLRFLGFKGLPLVAGAARLDEQLRLAGSRVHVFGHSHIAEDRTIDGVRYVQNWLRPPRHGDGGGGILKLVAEAEPSEGFHPLFC